MSITKTIQQMVDALASIANEPDRTLQQRPVRFAKAKEAIQAGRVLLESIAKQEQGEPVAVYGYCPECGSAGVTREKRPDGDDRCGNGHAYKSRNSTTTQQQRKPLTDEQKDAARYRWLFNDVDLAAIKDAFDKQKAPPANLHSAVIEQIVGFYSDKASVDMMIDSTIEAAHGIKE